MERFLGSSRDFVVEIMICVLNDDCYSQQSDGQSTSTSCSAVRSCLVPTLSLDTIWNYGVTARSTR